MRAIIGKAQTASKKLLLETKLLKAILLGVQKKVRSMVEMASVFSREYVCIYYLYCIYIVMHVFKDRMLDTVDLLIFYVINLFTMIIMHSLSSHLEFKLHEGKDLCLQQCLVSDRPTINTCLK